MFGKPIRLFRMFGFTVSMDWSWLVLAALIVWDGGVYENLRRDRDGKEVPMHQAIEDGHVTVRLEGRKLRGGFALTRTRAAGDKEDWIFVKMRDEYAGSEAGPGPEKDRSILSGRTLEEVDSPQEEVRTGRS